MAPSVSLQLFFFCLVQIGPALDSHAGSVSGSLNSACMRLAACSAERVRAAPRGLTCSKDGVPQQTGSRVALGRRNAPSPSSEGQSPPFPLRTLEVRSEWYLERPR